MFFRTRSASLALLLVTALGATACAAGEPDVDSPEPSAEHAEQTGTTQEALTLATHTVYGLTGVQLDTRWASEKAAGYRPMSVSAYGTNTTDVRFAASFVQRAGADWKVYRGVGHTAFQTVFDGMAQDHYKPTLLSFDGSETNPVWVAVFEKTTGGIPYTRMALVNGDGTSQGHVEYWLLKAQTDKLIPSTFTAYGSASAPRYALVLEPNASKVAWSIGTISKNGAGKWNGFGLDETSAEHVTRFNVQTSARNRPSLVSVRAGGKYATLYRADAVGAWAYKTGLTASALATEIAAQQSAGRVVTYLEGSGTGTATKYDAIFAESDQPQTRTFQAWGSGKAGDNAIPVIDDVFKTYMARNDVRHAGLAVVDGKRLVYARGYNMAEPGYPVVGSSSRFRLASVSKTVTAMEIMHAVDHDHLDLERSVQDILHLKTWKGEEPDERFATIKVKHLLQHSFPTLTDADGTVNCLKRELDTSLGAANAMGMTLPLARDPAIGYTLAASDLVRPRGTGNCYSNFGYVLLGKVIEAVKGRSYTSALVQDLVSPLSITRFTTATPVNAAGEAFYRSGSNNVWASVNLPGAPLAPAPHAGWNYGAIEAAGGLSMAAPDVARLLAMLNTRTKNTIYSNNVNVDTDPTTVDIMLNNAYGFDQVVMGNGFYPAWVKGGYLDGLQSSVVYRQLGASYVLFFARSELSPSGLPEDGWYPTWNTLDQVLGGLDLKSLPDQFPLYNMPSF